MHKRKNFLLLAALAVLAISCSLTSQQTSGAALLSNEPGTPTASANHETGATPTQPPTRCTVTAHALNVRNCGGVDCGVIAQVTHGAILTVTSTADGWHRVQLDTGAAGFVNSNYCKSGE